MFVCQVMHASLELCMSCVACSQVQLRLDQCWLMDTGTHAYGTVRKDIEILRFFFVSHAFFFNFNGSSVVERFPLLNTTSEGKLGQKMKKEDPRRNTQEENEQNVLRREQNQTEPMWNKL